MIRRLTLGIGFLVVAAALLVGGYRWWRTKNVSTVQRGWSVANDKGCFTCHGPGGTQGMLNPGYGLESIPEFTGGMITMYAESEAEIREWILDGVPQRIRNDPEQRKLREGMLIPMPAWRGLLSDREVSDLVAYVKAVSDFEKPKDERAEEGRQVAVKYGCFNCHGPQGRGSMPNIRAFKGYIPSWDGADFPELAENDEEVREWILNGGTHRLYSNSIARWIISRQPIQMPAYRDVLSTEEVDRLLDYIHWLRLHPY
jgi:mono/diheme cytochrome c family protein